ncbi:hypothetical protein CMI44_01560 [Candidatus Pacearchaeota archaeon]|jgi:energy-coupling factor transporter ATP-binding protein EcfA2|nr:hypothetical protein [Candidatus Pacearchaeota archaeon]|tara:strand:- start:537 stop:980 length:444 start_codon:yes stop_codon:yes gene_type:complete
MKGLVNGVLDSLNNGNIVTIQGSSGVGKSETVELLKNLLEQEGKRAVYLDMRHIKSSFQFYKEVAQQLGIEKRDSLSVYSELNKGNIALLLDEYWAGAQMTNQIVMFAHQKNNYVVTVAGTPMGVELDELAEYVLQERNKIQTSINL